MRITITSVMVDDQERALQFYTKVLGFVKKADIPAGEHRWLTVVSPEAPQTIELLLEPNDNHAAKTYQQALYLQGIPATMFTVDNLKKEVDRLKQHGVRFTIGPSKLGPVTMAVFDDTCGNLIQLTEGL